MPLNRDFLDYPVIRDVLSGIELYDHSLREISKSMEDCLDVRITNFLQDHKTLISISTGVVAMSCYCYTHPESSMHTFFGLITGLFFQRTAFNLCTYPINGKFIRAVMTKDFATAEQLSSQIDPNAFDTNRRWDTPLHAVIRLMYGEPRTPQEMVQYKTLLLKLVAMGGDLNRKNKELFSGMHLVLMSGDMNFFAALSMLGGNININANHISAVDYAAVVDQTAVATLIAYGANADTYFSYEAMSKLRIYTDFDDVKNAIESILKKENPSYEIAEDQTIKLISPLFFAVLKDKVELAKTLIVEGKIDLDHFYAFQNEEQDGKMKMYGTIAELKEYMSPEMKNLF